MKFPGIPVLGNDGDEVPVVPVPAAIPSPSPSVEVPFVGVPVAFMNSEDGDVFWNPFIDVVPLVVVVLFVTVVPVLVAAPKPDAPTAVLVALIPAPENVDTVPVPIVEVAI